MRRRRRRRRRGGGEVIDDQRSETDSPKTPSHLSLPSRPRALPLAVGRSVGSGLLSLSTLYCDFHFGFGRSDADGRRTGRRRRTGRWLITAAVASVAVAPLTPLAAAVLNAASVACRADGSPESGRKDKEGRKREISSAYLMKRPRRVGVYRVRKGFQFTRTRTDADGRTPLLLRPP